jgi:hypothetical protein
MDEHPAPDYVERLIAQRCGEETADAIVPVETLGMMLEIITAQQDRIDELALRCVEAQDRLEVLAPAA